MSNVMFLPLSQKVSQREENGSAVNVRVVGKEEGESWARTSAEGWSEYKEFAHLLLEMGRVVATAKGNALFLAELDGQVVGVVCGSEHDSVLASSRGTACPAGGSISVCKSRWMRPGDDGRGAWKFIAT
jgi:hypothetical protein